MPGEFNKGLKLYFYLQSIFVNAPK